jgi:enoyl-CoA hydratase/carnithine racemase
VVPLQELSKTTLELAMSLLRGGPKTLVKTKELLEEMYPGDFEKELAHALKYHEKVADSEEAREGIQAFLQKRDPDF